MGTEYLLLNCASGLPGVPCDEQGVPITRETTILNARREYARRKDELVVANGRLTFGALCSKAAFISQQLADQGFDVLSPTEEKAVEYRDPAGNE